jgi:hypothetical protein
MDSCWAPPWLELNWWSLHTGRDRNRRKGIANSKHSDKLDPDLCSD